jgi:hypothetical protein
MALKLDNSDDQLHGIQEIRLDSSSEQGVEGDLKKAELVPTQAEDEDQTDRQNVMFIYVY